MSIAPGVRLGTYEVIGLIGAGGMGQVYRAHDRGLGRDVALKVLPEESRSHPDRVARFDREARMLASLRHPHVATVYGLQEIPGSAAQSPSTAIVMELVDGLTLDDRLRVDGPLPLHEALTIARQVAEALDAAHEMGIVHRDLKPSNIKVSPGGEVKVLDFGLARFVDRAPDLGSTITAAVTGEGVVLGTPRYMSPEQAKGQPLDKRTDIWSFGCVLYELLTGRPAFPGETRSDTVAAILTGAPDWNALPAGTPASIRKLLTRLLEKDPRRRLRDIGDARFEIEAAAAPAEPASRSGQRAVWAGAAVVAALLTAGGIIAGRASNSGTSAPPDPAPLDPVAMTVSLPAGVSIVRGPGHASSLALSPDGRVLVIAGTGATGSRLYRRPRETHEATPIQGTEGGSGPFFSPDGLSIGFFADGRLKRVPAEGGIATDIAVTPGAFLVGASWGSDDRIYFVSGGRSPVHVVDANGGAPTPLLELAPDEISHSSPQILPDGRTLLFASRGWIHAFDVATGKRAEVVQGASPKHVEGYVVFKDPDPSKSTLLAAPFDPAALALTVKPVPLLQEVATEMAMSIAHYAVGGDGTLAYVPGAREHELVLVATDGSQRPITDAGVYFENPQFSIDGRQVAVASRRRAGEATEIWVHDVETGSSSRLTLGGGRAPVWTPDGLSVTYSRPKLRTIAGAVHQDERFGIFTRRADETGDAALIVPLDEFHWLVDWTPDGTLAYGVMEGVTADGTSPSSIMAWRDGSSSRVVGPGAVWGGRLSSDGRWLAYYVTEAGQFTVFVTPFPSGGTPSQIAYGSDPSWSPDGNELYYRNGNRLMAARLEMKGAVRAIAHRVVVEPFLPPLYDDYDVRKDGTLALVRPVDDPEGREIRMIVGWLSDPSHALGP